MNSLSWKKTALFAILIFLIQSSNLSAQVSRFSSKPGALDPAFGSHNDGLVISNFSSASEGIHDLRVLSDDSIVVAGYASVQAEDHFLIAKYTRDGSLNPNFGTSGSTKTTFEAGGNAQAEAMVIDSQDRIVVAGWSNTQVTKIAVARYTPQGALDTTFSNDGKVVLAIGAGNSEAAAVTIQNDGKIVVAGHMRTTTNPAVTQVAVARYLENGQLDTSFGGGDGHVETPVGDLASASEVAIQKDGKILIMGRAAPQSGAPDILLIRYLSTGVVDSSFGLNGIVVTDIDGGTDTANAAVLNSDGTIMVAGSATVDGDGHMVVGRYLPTGAIDSQFGVSGFRFIDFGVRSTGLDIIRGEAGAVMVAGCVNTSEGMVFGLTRVTSSGALDSLFGTQGLVTTPINTTNACGNALSLQDPDKVVVGGHAIISGANRDSVLARYDASPSEERYFMAVPFVSK